MSINQTYSMHSNIFQELMALLGQTVQNELIHQIQYLKTENEILPGLSSDRTIMWVRNPVKARKFAKTQSKVCILTDNMPISRASRTACLIAS